MALTVSFCMVLVYVPLSRKNLPYPGVTCTNFWFLGKSSSHDLLQQLTCHDALSLIPAIAAQVALVLWSAAQRSWQPPACSWTK